MIWQHGDKMVAWGQDGSVGTKLLSDNVAGQQHWEGSGGMVATGLQCWDVSIRMLAFEWQHLQVVQGRKHEEGTVRMVALGKNFLPIWNGDGCIVARVFLMGY